MYTYNFSDNQTEETAGKTVALDELEQKFNQVDSKFNFTTGVNPEDYQSSLDLQKQSFEGLTEEQIKKQAEDSLHDYSNESKEKIENDYTSKKEAYETSLANLSESTSESKENLSEAYNQAKTDASNDAIKRGLARSSIIVNKLAKYDESMLTEFSNIEKTYLETSQKLNSEKNLLEVQKQNALDSFDISYAIKISEKINDISEKLSQKEREVIEYNNKVIQMEKEYELEQLEKLEAAKQKSLQTNLDYAEFAKDGGIAVIDSMVIKEKYQIAKDYLMSLSKQQALQELQNNSMFSTQLKSGYVTLLNEIQSRKDN